jgi:hypothetical protein
LMIRHDEEVDQIPPHVLPSSRCLLFPATPDYLLRPSASTNPINILLPSRSHSSISLR